MTHTNGVGMIFAKVDVTLLYHYRVLDVTRPLRAAALGVWIAALCYSRGQDLDGFCPTEALGLLGCSEAVDELVRVGLFARGTRDGVDGVVVLKYAEHNETKSVVTARRAEAAARQKKSRSKRKATTDLRLVASVEAAPEPAVEPVSLVSDRPSETLRIDGGHVTRDSRVSTGSDSDSEIPSLFSDFQDGDPGGSTGEVPAVTPVTPVTEPVTQPVTRDSQARSRTSATNVTGDGAFGLAVAALADGIRSVTGVPFAPPKAGAELQKLIGAMLAHCPDVASRVDWARTAGAGYALAYAGQRLNCHGFVDWLNSGRPEHLAGTRKIVELQPVPVTGRVWKVGGRVDG